MVLQFGKYKGLNINDPEVPTSHLEWLLNRLIEDAKEIKVELGRREQTESGSLTFPQQMVLAGYRILASKHKDDPDALHDLADARAALESVLEEYSDRKRTPGRIFHEISVRELLQEKHGSKDLQLAQDIPDQHE